MRDQRTLFDLTQDGLVIGNKLQRIYLDFDVDAFGILAKHRCTRGADIRAFIIKDPNRCFERFGEWVNDENANLRSFVSASLCTRGTWQKWLRPYIEDPQPILALLEILKDDPDRRVREHVAIDMRDIVKDYPEAGYVTLERWQQDG